MNLYKIRMTIGELLLRNLILLILNLVSLVREFKVAGVRLVTEMLMIRTHILMVIRMETIIKSAATDKRSQRLLSLYRKVPVHLIKRKSTAQILRMQMVPKI